MRRETMAQRMGRCTVRQSENGPQPAHLALDDTGIQRSAAGADKQGRLRVAGIGTLRQIIGDGLGHGRQQRHQSLLPALAGDGHRLAFGRRAARQRQSFAETQAAAIKQ